ncbi:MAG: hypothetical protein EZS28_036106, partial [Streblomastix strix]
AVGFFCLLLTAKPRGSTIAPSLPVKVEKDISSYVTLNKEMILLKVSQHPKHFAKMLEFGKHRQFKFLVTSPFHFEIIWHPLNLDYLFIVKLQPNSMGQVNRKKASIHVYATQSNKTKCNSIVSDPQLHIGLAMRRDSQPLDHVVIAKQHFTKSVCWERNSFDPDKWGEGEIMRQDCNSLDPTMQHAITAVRKGDSPLDPVKQLNGQDDVKQQQYSESQKEQMRDRVIHSRINESSIDKLVQHRLIVSQPPNTINRYNQSSFSFPNSNVRPQNFHQIQNSNFAKSILLRSIDQLVED